MNFDVNYDEQCEICEKISDKRLSPWPIVYRLNDDFVINHLFVCKDCLKKIAVVHYDPEKHKFCV